MVGNDTAASFTMPRSWRSNAGRRRTTGGDSVLPLPRRRGARLPGRPARRGPGPRGPGPLQLRRARRLPLRDALRLDRTDLDQFLRTHPAAAIDLMSSMGRRLRVSAERLRHTASRNVNVEAEDKRTTVQKAADWIADFSGSIPFLLLHVAFFAAWILLNVPRIPGAPMFDPFPYGLLTMVVSLEAIILSVFVLLTQNRQLAKERIRSDIEYEVNIKAEMEVAHLHEKVDLLNANTADTAAHIRHLERLIERRPGS